MRGPVFLGGSCGASTWRTNIAIPRLEAAGIASYNPQVPEWTPELIRTEARAKMAAAHLLFVIDGVARSITSMGEAMFFLEARPRDLTLVVEDIPDGQVIEGSVITGRELLDLNRARAYVRDAAKSAGVPLHVTVDAAMDPVIAVMANR